MPCSPSAQNYKTKSGSFYLADEWEQRLEREGTWLIWNFSHENLRGERVQIKEGGGWRNRRSCSTKNTSTANHFWGSSSLELSSCLSYALCHLYSIWLVVDIREIYVIDWIDLAFVSIVWVVLVWLFFVVALEKVLELELWGRVLASSWCSLAALCDNYAQLLRVLAAYLCSWQYVQLAAARESKLLSYLVISLSH